VYELGLQLFRDNVARAPRIKDRLLKMMLSLIQRVRVVCILFFFAGILKWCFLPPRAAHYLTFPRNEPEKWSIEAA
jgi:hypothetical protein